MNKPSEKHMVIKDDSSAVIFTPADIVWFKNVTDRVNGEAYLNLSDSIFQLHFPNRHETNVLTPNINEIILIYQKVNGVQAFTHLVTPVDEQLIEVDNSDDYRYARQVKVIAKTDNNNYIPVSETLWDRVNLRGITQGNACNISNIKNIGNIEELQLDIWRRFNGHFISEELESETTTSAIITALKLTSPDFIATEGGMRMVSHIIKERNRSIVKEKKQKAIKNNQLKCAVCDFSFSITYNVEFIECHHLTPIGQVGVRETTLDDLALVCANCHRMLHKKFDGNYLTINQLQGKLKKKQ
jgi:5-methylcytosine-specific restriction enzyme A